MMWQRKQRVEMDGDWHWYFPMLKAVCLDDGLCILWEWVLYRTTITEEYEGMGAGICKGFTEYRSRQGAALGIVSFTV